MTQFEALDDGVEVNGQTVMAFIEGVPDTFEERTASILANHGIEDPEPDEWYPQQAWLDAFEEIATNIGSSTLGNIGKAIPNNAEWPPGVEDVDEGIESIDEAYHMNHRGGEIGSYESEVIDDSTVRVRCTNPYPCDFDKGIVEATAKEFASGYVSVTEVGDECREDAGDVCVSMT